jgi:hypothetical protein
MIVDVNGWRHTTVRDNKAIFYTIVRTPAVLTHTTTARCVWSFLQHSPGKQWRFPAKHPRNTAAISERTRIWMPGGWRYPVRASPWPALTPPKRSPPSRCRAARTPARTTPAPPARPALDRDSGPENVIWRPRNISHRDSPSKISLGPREQSPGVANRDRRTRDGAALLAAQQAEQTQHRGVWHMHGGGGGQSLGQPNSNEWQAT